MSISKEQHTLPCHEGRQEASNSPKRSKIYAEIGTVDELSCKPFRRN